jgi:hypothetical protein
VSETEDRGRGLAGLGTADVVVLLLGLLLLVYVLVSVLTEPAETGRAAQSSAETTPPGVMRKAR